MFTDRYKYLLAQILFGLLIVDSSIFSCEHLQTSKDTMEGVKPLTTDLGEIDAGNVINEIVDDTISGAIVGEMTAGVETDEMTTETAAGHIVNEPIAISLDIDLITPSEMSFIPQAP